MNTCRARGWVWWCNIQKEMEEGIVPEPEIETVIFEYIDRGIRDFQVFAEYIREKYPNIRDLWVDQNYIGNGSLVDFYKSFGFRSMVIEVNQGGLPYKDMKEIDPPRDGLISLCEDHSDFYSNYSEKQHALKLGVDLDVDAHWYKFCMMYAGIDTRCESKPVLSEEHIGSGEYKSALPLPTT